MSSSFAASAYAVYSTATSALDSAGTSVAGYASFMLAMMAAHPMVACTAAIVAVSCVAGYRSHENRSALKDTLFNIVTQTTYAGVCIFLMPHTIFAYACLGIALMAAGAAENKQARTNISNCAIDISNNLEDTSLSGLQPIFYSIFCMPKGFLNAVCGTALVGAFFGASVPSAIFAVAFGVASLGAFYSSYLDGSYLLDQDYPAFKHYRPYYKFMEGLNGLLAKVTHSFVDSLSMACFGPQQTR